MLASIRTAIVRQSRSYEKCECFHKNVELIYQASFMKPLSVDRGMWLHGGHVTFVKLLSVTSSYVSIACRCGSGVAAHLEYCSQCTCGRVFLLEVAVAPMEVSRSFNVHCFV